MATDQVMQELKRGVETLYAAYNKTAVARQQIVITAIVLRQNGYVLDAGAANDFDKARGALMLAAQDLDNVLDAMRGEDNSAWMKIVTAMDEKMKKITNARISSTSVVEMFDVALPIFPRALLSPKSSPASNLAETLEMEAATYDVKLPAPKTKGGLGFIPAIASIGPACSSGVAAGAVTGIGAVIVGVGCALLAAAVVVGALYLTYKAVSQIPRLVQSFSPQAAASLAEAERLESAAKYVKAAGDAKVDAETLKKVVEQTAGQPKSDGIPWAFVLVAGLVAVYFLRKPEIRSRFQRYLPQRGVMNA